MSIRRTICAVILALGAGAASAAEYKAAWTAENFFAEVTECKKAMVLSAADSYIKRGQEKGHAAQSLRSEAIAMVPTFDTFATKTCYCALNEVAKAKPYGTQLAADIMSYAQNPRCKAEMAATMDAFKKNPKALQLQ